MKRVLAILSILFAVSIPPAATANTEGDPITGFSSSDKTMNAAIDNAISTLPLFLGNAMDDKGYGIPGASLKVSFPVENDGISQNEIIWIGPFLRLSDTHFTGLLANQPNFMPGLNAGDQVDFHRNSIKDWALWHQDGTSSGNFTTRVIAKGMGADGQDLMDRMRVPAVPATWK